MSMAPIDSPSERIRRITLTDEKTLNSMSFPLVEDFYESLEIVAADNNCDVVILTGAGRSFCAGLNLDEVGMPPGSEGLTLARIADRSMAYMSNLVPTMRAIPQPIIAAVNGPAFGGGMCLTLGADIRLAGESAIWNGTGINNGLAGTELGVSFLLPRLIGASRANEIILSGRRVDGTEAERIGLASRVVPDDQLMAEAIQLAEQISSYSTHGVEMTKRVLWANLETSSLTAAIDLENRNQLLVRMLTQNLDEAVRARREKRKPVFRDELV